MLAAIALVAIGSRAGVALRLSIAGAAVAAASGFLLDDPAAMTLAASPRSLRRRCLQRVTAVVLCKSRLYKSRTRRSPRSSSRMRVSGALLVFAEVGLGSVR